HLVLLQVSRANGLACLVRTRTILEDRPSLAKPRDRPTRAASCRASTRSRHRRLGDALRVSAPARNTAHRRRVTARDDAGSRLRRRPPQPEASPWFMTNLKP